MRSAALFVSLLAVTWIAVVESVFVVTALALGGLAALKGAALVGFTAGRHSRYHRHRYYGRSYGHHGGYYGHHGSHQGHGYRYGRSVENFPADAGEDLLLSAVEQLDPNGCVLKLLCQVHIKEESTRTFEESILVEMFANDTESLTTYNAAFVYATDIGIKTQDPSACKKYFPNCPLNEEQLSSLLQQSWGCGFDFFQDDTDDEPQEEVVEREVQTPAPTEVSLVELTRGDVFA